MVKVIKFVLYIFKSLFSLLDMIPQAISMMVDAIGLLPLEITGICVAALSILVIFTVVGRGS